MPPQRPNLILPTHIPHIKLNILIRDRLNIKPHRRNSRHVLVELQLVEDCRLSGCVESEHQQAHLFRSEDLAHHFGDLASHCDGAGGGRELVGGSRTVCAALLLLGFWILETEKVGDVEE